MNEADILALTYYHSCNIFRMVNMQDGPFDDFERKEIYKDLKCAISFSQGSTQNVTDTVQPIEYIATLFARPGIETKTGDEVVANIEGRMYEFVTGEEVPYSSHIEVPLMRKDRA